MSNIVLRDRLRAALEAAKPQASGRVKSVVGLSLTVEGVDAAIGETVTISTPQGPLLAEVIALADDSLVCLPLGEVGGIRLGSKVKVSENGAGVPIGAQLLGRVLDGLGRPIDDGPPLTHLPKVNASGNAPHPLRRANVDHQLALGVRVLDTLIPCGRGQRLGIFAGSGVGKSSLLSMVAHGTAADVSVIALVGERGREVREFIEGDLGPEGLARSVVIVATSDEPALVRLQAAQTATRIAEWFRDEGNDVVLMMDSVTRVCMAQREVGLAAGEPPATRGYPPSVFGLLAKLLERAGAAENGSITGLYTVLVEGDDMNEPIADAARSILDGHIVLSRRLASSGHYPCVEVLDSVSRVAPRITTPEQQSDVTQLRSLLAAYREAKDLVEIGAYVQGTNPVVDRALHLQGAMDMFLRQGVSDVADCDESWRALHMVVSS